MMVPLGAEHGQLPATVAGLSFVHTRETDGGITFAAETAFFWLAIQIPSARPTSRSSRRPLRLVTRSLRWRRARSSGSQLVRSSSWS